MALAKYDPKLVVIEFSGIVTGYADGTFVKIGRSTDTWKLVVGADGTVVRVRSRDATGTITVTLLQSSITNDVFSALSVLDELTGEGVLPCLVKDLNGSGLAVASEAWVIMPAEMEFGKELSNREWRIQCADLSIGGGAIL